MSPVRLEANFDDRDPGYALEVWLCVFPLGVLPGWLEFMGKLLPTRFAFDGVRAALFEGAAWEATRSYYSATA